MPAAQLDESIEETLKPSPSAQVAPLTQPALAAPGTPSVLANLTAPTQLEDTQLEDDSTGAGDGAQGLVKALRSLEAQQLDAAAFGAAVAAKLRSAPY